MPRAILGVMDCRSDIPVLRDGMYDQGAGAESLILSPGLNRSLEPGSPIESCYPPIDVAQARSASAADARCWKTHGYPRLSVWHQNWLWIQKASTKAKTTKRGSYDDTRDRHQR